MPRLAVDSVECFGRTDPQDSLTILVYCANEGLSRSFRTGKMRNCLEGQRVGREMGYPHPPQSNPDAPLSIRK